MRKISATKKFSATAHGKRPYDGVGGSVKRLPALEVCKDNTTNRSKLQELFLSKQQKTFQNYISPIPRLFAKDNIVTENFWNPYLKKP